MKSKLTYKPPHYHKLEVPYLAGGSWARHFPTPSTTSSSIQEGDSSIDAPVETPPSSNTNEAQNISTSQSNTSSNTSIATTSSQHSSPQAEIERPQYFTAEYGDTLWKIAKKYHTTVDAIVEANKDKPTQRGFAQIKDKDLIYAGASYYLPSNAYIDTPDNNQNSTSSKSTSYSTQDATTQNGSEQFCLIGSNEDPLRFFRTSEEIKLAQEEFQKQSSQEQQSSYSTDENPAPSNLTDPETWNDLLLAQDLGWTPLIPSFKESMSEESRKQLADQLDALALTNDTTPDTSNFSIFQILSGFFKSFKIQKNDIYHPAPITTYSTLWAYDLTSEDAPEFPPYDTQLISNMFDSPDTTYTLPNLANYFNNVYAPQFSNQLLYLLQQKYPDYFTLPDNLKPESIYSNDELELNNIISNKDFFSTEIGLDIVALPRISIQSSPFIYLNGNRGIYTCVNIIDFPRLKLKLPPKLYQNIFTKINTLYNKKALSDMRTHFNPDGTLKDHSVNETDIQNFRKNEYINRYFQNLIILNEQDTPLLPHGAYYCLGPTDNNTSLMYQYIDNQVCPNETLVDNQIIQVPFNGTTIYIN